jgi:ribosomal protein S18 acetylase RimI-like enzyme
MNDMTPFEFEKFQKKSIERRAKYHEDEADLNSEDALAKANEEFGKYCPQGLSTPNQFFYNVVLDDKISTGYLWFAIRERNGKKRLFINDIFVEESYRGRGLSKFMMTWLEEKANEMGLAEIGLHVLGNNLVARGLYEKMGYTVTNLDMTKKL